eukprot:CAMPEP_0184291488 /NCGR_PEP_ID=MMETSP1049-20130417/3507_1 /TAXON_ID=77928 /ORGANISM="Proteomonas sulcata, Strain CCMP704" /LENGTH=268 /DNA_ID=CAMNT_0026598957 /DNA_START=139 /DNA_END=945 /DNA_ORIENTATION=-
MECIRRQDAHIVAVSRESIEIKGKGKMETFWLFEDAAGPQDVQSRKSVDSRDDSTPWHPGSRVLMDDQLSKRSGGGFAIQPDNLMRKEKSIARTVSSALGHLPAGLPLAGKRILPSMSKRKEPEDQGKKSMDLDLSWISWITSANQQTLDEIKAAGAGPSESRMAQHQSRLEPLHCDEISGDAEAKPRSPGGRRHTITGSSEGSPQPVKMEGRRRSSEESPSSNSGNSENSEGVSAEFVVNLETVRVEPPDTVVSASSSEFPRTCSEP